MIGAYSLASAKSGYDSYHAFEMMKNSVHRICLSSLLDETIKKHFQVYETAISNVSGSCVCYNVRSAHSVGMTVVGSCDPNNVKAGKCDIYSKKLDDMDLFQTLPRHVGPTDFPQNRCGGIRTPVAGRRERIFPEIAEKKNLREKESCFCKSKLGVLKYQR